MLEHHPQKAVASSIPAAPAAPAQQQANTYYQAPTAAAGYSSGADVVYTAPYYNYYNYPYPYSYSYAYGYPYWYPFHFG
jgi:hypothetical protein